MQKKMNLKRKINYSEKGKNTSKKERRRWFTRILQKIEHDFQKKKKNKGVREDDLQNTRRLNMTSKKRRKQRESS